MSRPGTLNLVWNSKPLGRHRLQLVLIGGNSLLNLRVEDIRRNTEPSMTLPFCDTCGQAVTLHEIEDNYHNGHRFDVAEAGALNLLRMFVNTRATGYDDGRSPQIRKGHMLLPRLKDMTAVLVIASLITLYSTYLCMNAWLKQ